MKIEILIDKSRKINVIKKKHFFNKLWFSVCFSNKRSFLSVFCSGLNTQFKRDRHEPCHNSPWLNVDFHPMKSKFLYECFVI